MQAQWVFNPATGIGRLTSFDIGKTYGVPGSGGIHHSEVIPTSEGWRVVLHGWASTFVSDELGFPDVINFELAFELSFKGGLVRPGMLTFDGYPSFEFFIYGQSGGVTFRWGVKETNLWELFGGSDHKEFIK